MILRVTNMLRLEGMEAVVLLNVQSNLQMSDFCSNFEADNSTVTDESRLYPDLHNEL